MNHASLCLVPLPRQVMRSASSAELALTLPQRRPTPEEWSEALLDSTDALGAVLRRRSTADWLSGGQDLPDGFAPEQGYVLQIESSGVTLAADTDAGRRNALHTLAQLLFQFQETGRIPAMTIYDWPCMTLRCAHLCYHLAQPWMPLSFPSHAALIRLVKRLAHYKYNAVLLEIEPLFPYRRHPDVSAPHAFTRQEVEALRGTCARWGVEIIPLLQCLGHAYAVLRVPRFAELRETPDTLQQYCPSNPRTRDLFLELADELIEGFGPLQRFHIGGDESRRLGICPVCRASVATEGVGPLYGRHVGAVAEAILERGVAPLAWADMIEHHPAALAFLPPETELVHWKYSMRSHGVGMDFSQFGARRVWAAAGVRFGRCNHTMHLFQEALQGIACLAAEAKRTGCDRWIVTDWMKATPFELSEFTQVFAVECAWQAGRSLDEFTAAYTRLAHGIALPETWRAYAALEPLLPYCEDAQARQYDGLDRHDYTGGSFRERLAEFCTGAERTTVRERMNAGLAGAETARRIVARIPAGGTHPGHVREVLELSVETHAHKARLGLALDDAVCLLKYPRPDHLAQCRLLAAQFSRLIAEHDALRTRSLEILARETLSPNWKALVEVKLEQAARDWMLYLREVLREGRALPMLLGEDSGPRVDKRPAPPAC